MLIAGGICTIGFTFYFAAESLLAQMSMTVIVTFMLCLNVLLVYFYGRPYSGDLKINPTSLEHVQYVLSQAPLLKQYKGKPTKPDQGSAEKSSPQEGSSGQDKPAAESRSEE